MARFGRPPSLARAALPATAAYSLDAPVDKWLTEVGQQAALSRDLRPPYPRRQALVGRRQTHHTPPTHITEEPNIVLNRIYSPSVATLRTLLMAVSLVAMALAGSAGANWG